MSAVAPVLCLLLAAADDPPKAEVEGFTVALESATARKGATARAGQSNALMIALKVEAKDSADTRKAVVLSKTTTSPEIPGVRWNVSATQSFRALRSGLDASLEPASRATTTGLMGTWQSEDKAPEKLDFLEGELAIVETTNQSYAFTGGELVPGATQKQGDVDVRLYCYDIDPEDEAVQVGLRFKGPPRQVARRAVGGIDNDAVLLGSLQQEAALPQFELELEDGSRVKATSQSRWGSYPNCRCTTQFTAKGKKPKALHIVMQTVVGEPKRVPFRLENVAIMEGPASVRPGIALPAVPALPVLPAP